MKVILYLSLIITSSLGNEFKFYNHCPFTVWPGLLGNPGKGNPENGGFALGQYQTRSVFTSNDWAGRFWGRTNCDGTGHCQTGDCGNRIQCNGAGGVPPVTLVEVSLAGWGNKDFYDVSLVDGYNLPIRVKPIPGTYRTTGGGKYDCGEAGCNADLNARCPGELAIKSGQWTVACMSACMKFNTDQYCCRGAYNTAQTCRSSAWPHNYPAIFKQACPNAYSYAFDDSLSTFTCQGNPHTAYEITFCP